MSQHDTGHSCTTPEHTGCCSQPDDMEQVQRRIDRRKLDLSAEEFAEKARENRRTEDDGGMSRRSVLGGAAGLAAAGFAAPVAFSETADAHGADEPVYTTSNLNIRSQPTTSAGVVKTAQEGTGMIIQSGPHHNDGYTWWGVRVNGCGNNTSRVEGFVAEDWTGHPNFSYGTWGYVSSVWGDSRSHGYHQGIDIANDKGTPIFAARQGTVTYAGWASGYGNVVYIDHGNGYESRYAHMSQIRTSQGAWVGAGERIGDMGTTGNSSGDHLHFEIRRYGDDLNWPQVRYANQWLNTAVPRNFPGISGAVYPGYPY